MHIVAMLIMRFNSILHWSNLQKYMWIGTLRTKEIHKTCHFRYVIFIYSSSLQHYVRLYQTQFPFLFWFTFCETMIIFWFWDLEYYILVAACQLRSPPIRESRNLEIAQISKQIISKGCFWLPSTLLPND